MPGSCRKMLWHPARGHGKGQLKGRKDTRVAQGTSLGSSLQPQETRTGQGEGKGSCLAPKKTNSTWRMGHQMPPSPELGGRGGEPLQSWQTGLQGKRWRGFLKVGFPTGISPQM